MRLSSIRLSGVRLSSMRLSGVRLSSISLSSVRYRLAAVDRCISARHVSSLATIKLLCRCLHRFCWRHSLLAITGCLCSNSCHRRTTGYCTGTHHGAGVILTTGYRFRPGCRRDIHLLSHVVLHLPHSFWSDIHCITQRAKASLCRALYVSWVWRALRRTGHCTHGVLT